MFCDDREESAWEESSKGLLSKRCSRYFRFECRPVPALDLHLLRFPHTEAQRLSLVSTQRAVDSHTMYETGLQRTIETLPLTAD